MCESDLKFDDFVLRVHERLNQDKIKLWLPPYYDEDKGCREDEELTKAMRDLSEKFCQEFNMEPKVSEQVLCRLQNKALSKLKEREQFKETGTATIHVRVSGNKAFCNSISVALKLTDLVSDLRAKVSERINLSGSRIKLICKGIVLNDESSLCSQNVLNGSQVMAVVLHENPKEILEKEKQQKFLEDTKADVQMLAGRSGDDEDLYLQVTDQNGHALQMPSSERKALVTAMTLHEKGRAALKKEDHALALVLLLEADHEFSACKSQLLQSVDNYAVLNLDIAWCYMCLQSVTQLPEAEERLKKCEQSFHRSYGPNLERLIALKGTAGNEAALFMRLHLLQGIVLYHQNKREQAKQLLKRAEDELNALKVDDENLSLLVELGYTPAEARLGLRGAHGNVNLAVELINRKKKEKKEARQKEKEEKKRKKYGRCADGVQYVEPQFVNQLIDMGYAEMVAVYALQQTNNSVSDAVQFVQEHQDVATFISNIPVGSVATEQVAALGFNLQMVKDAIRKYHGNLQMVFDDLNRQGGGLLGFGAVSPFSAVNSDQECKKRMEQEQEALSRIAEDLNTGAEDHLDLTLISEEQFLKRYLDLLG